jgi:hypothetical protein
MPNYIIVPDGIAADKRGRPLQKPSFVYRQVLDYVLDICRKGDTIYLAPANKCGEEHKSEHELGYEYIMAKKELNVFCPTVTSVNYIDTYGNANHLKNYLQDKIKHLTFDLICANIHSYRAQYCFKKAGFNLNKIHRVSYRIYEERIVRRWWYYKYKPVHCGYEAISFMRDFLKK